MVHHKVSADIGKFRVEALKIRYDLLHRVLQIKGARVAVANAHFFRAKASHIVSMLLRVNMPYNHFVRYRLGLNGVGVLFLAFLHHRIPAKKEFTNIATYVSFKKKLTAWMMFDESTYIKY